MTVIVLLLAVALSPLLPLPRPGEIPLKRRRRTF